MKRNYEIAVVLRLDPNEEVLNAQIQEIQSWIEADELGTVTNADRWGRRKLAYEIDKQREGYYVFFYSDVDPKNLPEMERNLRLATHVLRYLVVRPEE